MILAANLHHYDSYYYYYVPAKIKHEEEFTTILETPPQKTDWFALCTVCYETAKFALVEWIVFFKYCLCQL